jgi:hypothetical protein
LSSPFTAIVYTSHIKTKRQTALHIGKDHVQQMLFATHWLRHIFARDLVTRLPH